MSNALCVAWRTPCLGLRTTSLQPPNIAAPFRSLPRQISPAWCLDSTPRRLLSSIRPSSVLYIPISTSLAKCQPPDRILSRHIQSSAALLAKKATTPPVENGVQVRDTPFSKAEIDKIFGARAKMTPAMGNRILSVLQSRRIDGTLDLDLPADITRAARPATLDAGLKYLRQNYDLDEEAAIMARIEREELETEQKLIRKAEELGLYKPQSGTYGAELGEQNDPSGKSVLKQIRERNEKRIMAEEEKKRREWLEGDEEYRQKMQQNLSKNTALQEHVDNSALEVKGRADPSARPLLAWIQKHHLRAMDTETDLSSLNTSGRLIPSFIFAIIALGLCYGFAVTYQPPAKQDRLWPNIPPAAATIAAIAGVNVGVLILWRLWPPAWRMLNRYFITVPAYPRVFSMIGNVFSHQKPWHLICNMLVLWSLGAHLHDDIGRGNFLALYFAAGIGGSLASLSTHVLKNQLFVTSLGASGAVSGIVAASALIRENDKWSIFFLPQEWREYVSAPAWLWLAGIVSFDLIGAVFNHRRPKLDYYAHLGGFLTGGVFAMNYRAKMRRERERNRGWFDRVISK
ncbi:hypothetical protein BDV18DRAFT_132720 [Aspergillus unguis]